MVLYLHKVTKGWKTPMMEKIRKMSLKELQALEKLVIEERQLRIENELSGHCKTVVESIENLLECCKKINRHFLGNIELECEECDLAMDFDILSEGILLDVCCVLRDYFE
jgi:hypothetical protein